MTGQGFVEECLGGNCMRACVRSAVHFAKFCVSPEFAAARALQRVPDRPLSLFEGDAGMLTFVSDAVAVAQAVHSLKDGGSEGSVSASGCGKGNASECDRTVRRCCAFPGLDL